MVYNEKSVCNMLSIMKLKLHENISGAQITFQAQVELSRKPEKQYKND